MLDDAERRRLQGEEMKKNSLIKPQAHILWIVLLSAAFTATAQYQIEEYVIASAGGQVDGGVYAATTTVGQTVAGGFTAASPYQIYAGFLHPATEFRTAAVIEISGRVTTHDGRGVPSATITLIDGTGIVRAATTDSGGYYKFVGVSAGMTCILTVWAELYSFAQPSIVVNAYDDLSGVNFISLP